MVTIARFATRHIDNKPDEVDLFLGVMFKEKSKYLQPDSVYEIQECLGELVIKRIGNSAIPTEWNKDISTILDYGIGGIITTIEEMQASRINYE